MKKAVFGTIAALLFALHQDIWLWREAQPLVLGFLPVGLAYHGAHTVAACLFFWALVRWAWPGHLEESK